MAWGIGDEVRVRGVWSVVVAWSRVPGGPVMLLVVNQWGGAVWVRAGEAV